MISPSNNCANCPRLAEFRQQNCATYPHYHNAPVPAFGELNATHLIVGLAPGLHGANQTARPFTGDYAGDVLYAALIKHGLAIGEYGKHASDGLRLRNIRITNSVRCVPPQNKPTTLEIATCGQFLQSEIANMHNLQRILVLGGVSHNATVKALGGKITTHPFKHGVVYNIANIELFCSYHTSRYNINTRVLTEAMFDDVIARFAG